jgi:exopolysaccharide production protein ExoY
MAESLQKNTMILPMVAARAKEMTVRRLLVVRHRGAPVRYRDDEIHLTPIPITNLRRKPASITWRTFTYCLRFRYTFWSNFLPTKRVGTSQEIQVPFQTRYPETAAADIYRFEPILGVALSILAMPVVVAAGAVLAILSHRSPFIAHRRVGRGGVPFWMWKLRTMWPDPASPAGPWQLIERIAGTEIPEQKSLTVDPRVRNRFSAFCRRHSIDELPQLIHVVCGQMSLVGPRPITREELDRHYGSGAEEILRMRPGLTGFWQINGRNSLTYDERYKLDLQLVREFSFRVYLAVLLKTLPKLINGADSR